MAVAGSTVRRFTCFGCRKWKSGRYTRLQGSALGNRKQGAAAVGRKDCCDMGNNQGALHKRERTADGQQRARQWAGASTHTMGGSTAEDGCPVQVMSFPGYIHRPSLLVPLRISKWGRIMGPSWPSVRLFVPMTILFIHPANWNHIWRGGSQ